MLSVLALCHVTFPILLFFVDPSVLVKGKKNVILLFDMATTTYTKLDFLNLSIADILVS